MRYLAICLAALTLLSPVGAPVSAEPVQSDAGLARLLRYPDVSATHITFVYGGDIWVVEMAGGLARRLTTGIGEELFPKFSPDGRWIAFTGQYSGNAQVYVVGVEGGTPRQLTFYNDVGAMPPRGGVDNQVLDWSPDGKNILFNAHRLPWSDRMTRPYVVPVDGGMETPLVVPEGGNGMFSPDGSKFVYAPIGREFRTWKRYRGGRNQDIWIFDLAKITAEPLVEGPAQDMNPCWIGDKVYVTSDRDADKIHNLYAVDLATKQPKKVTNHTDYDVLWASAGPGAVVYECGGYVYRFDTATGKSVRVPIRVAGDFPQALPHVVNVKDNIESYDISPSGVRAVFGARGDVFTVPAKEGEPRNITNSPGVREHSVTWSPDGKWIAYQSDRTGEYEWYVRAQDGSGTERRVTTGMNVWMFNGIWSPDGKKLLFGDKSQRLRYVDVETGKVTEVDTSNENDLNTYSWSPDSKWIAYSKAFESNYSGIWVYSLADGKRTQLTSGMTNDDNPVFDPKGRYLYFTSDRDFNLTFSGTEFNYVYTNPTRVYVAVLAKDGPALFLPQSDEEKPKEPKPSDRPNGTPVATPPAAATPAPPADASAKPADAAVKPADSGAKPAEAKLDVKIDADGFENRVRAIPGPSGNYGGLAATGDGIAYLAFGGGPPRLEFYNLEAKDKQVILEGIGGFAISGDGKSVLFARNGGFGILPLRPGGKANDGAIGVDRLAMRIDPRVEWQQMYVDVWRITRDWIYDPGVHGLDWKGIRAKYEVLIPHVQTRDDLNAVLGQLAGEINAGHAYVQGGDSVAPERVETGLLGADIVADPSGYFKIAKIYPGENWQEDSRSPFTEPGVKVATGDYILAVDGRPTREVRNFYELMEGKANRVVTLTVNSKPDLAGARDERIRPIRKETNLRYIDWVQERRALVSRLSGGRIGYVHLPNTAVEGNRELFKNFFPQIRKDALIFDDRYNGGGFIPDRMIELVARPILNYWVERGQEPRQVPGFAHNGPKAVLINGYSSSGGDAFPYYFRKLGLGPLIGTTTWGGLIGISGNPAMVDGGNITAPRFRFLDTDGKWAVEGEGVAPDIEVVDRPDLVAKGQDPTLERAVQVLLDQLKKGSPKRPKVPPVPSGR